MGTLVNLWEIWKRAETGPICPERRFETKVYWPRVKELAKEHDIRYEAENPVPMDASLMDDVFEAGFRLLLDVGILCIDTERIIKFTEDEIRDAMRTVQSRMFLGEGKEAVVAERRGLEDPQPPTVRGGPGASPLSEEMAQRVYTSYTKEPLVDALYYGTLTTLYGMPVKPKSPWEMQAEIANVAMMREACRIAGRPGMEISGTGSVSLAADVGASHPDYGYRKYERREAKLKPQLKVDYENLGRVANYMQYGGIGGSGGSAYIYGLAGGPETAVIVAVASGLAGPVLMGAKQIGAFAYNTSYTGTTDRVSLWASSLAQEAVGRNTHSLRFAASPYITYAGPCTSMSLHEIAARALAMTAVGANLSTAGGAGRQGKQIDHCSGLEARWAAEVGHASAGMKLKDVNVVVNALLSRYEDRLKDRSPPPGKPFSEIFDTERLVPSREYQELYERTRKELQDLGVDFERLNPKPS